jgi:hypothetical protein
LAVLELNHWYVALALLEPAVRVTAPLLHTIVVLGVIVAVIGAMATLRFWVNVVLQSAVVASTR